MSFLSSYHFFLFFILFIQNNFLYLYVRFSINKRNDNMKYSLEKYIVQNVNAPYVNVDVDSDNITIKLSLDKQADWNYGYWMNSRRAMFQIFWENDKIKIALMDCHSKLPKFRKCTVKTVDKALIKIDNWINNASRVEVVV